MHSKRLRYTGAAPGANTNTTVLFNVRSYERGEGEHAKFDALHIHLKNSAAGTLNAYFSDDGATWYMFHSQAVPASPATSVNKAEYHVAPYDYLKFEWVNGGVAQSTWVVQGSMCVSDFGQNAGSQDFFVRLQRGLVPNATAFSIVGKNNDVDAISTPETIWWSGGTYVWPAAAVSLEAVSSSADDSAAGTGCRTFIVSGLDANYVEQLALVTTDGLTPVALSGTWLRVNVARVDTAGSNGWNVGDITIRVAGAGATLAVIPINRGRTQLGLYTVPAGKTAYFLESNITFLRATGVEAAEIQYRTRDFGKAWVERLALALNPSSPYVFLPQRIAAPLAEKTDIELRVVYAAGSNTQIGIASTLLIFTNGFLSLG